MPYVYYSDEQKLRANSVDLEEYLSRRGEKLVRSGPEKRLTSDHSITVRGNEWFDHATGVERGGHAISFLMYHYDMSYVEAVHELLNGEQGQAYPEAAPKEEKERAPFELPPKGSSTRRVYAYLLKHRLIDRSVLNAFVRKKLIYESCEKSKDKTREYHNAVFVGYDEHGVARHAHKKGLYTQGPSFRRNVESSDPRYSFHYAGTSGRLYVFEAPIDLLSFISLHQKDWWKHSYVALCGTAEHAMLWMLEQDPKFQEVALCLDHDEAGLESVGRLGELLRERGLTAVSACLPRWKDWNEELKAAHGMPAQPPEEHPQLTAAVSICRRLGELCAGERTEALDTLLPGLLLRCRDHLHWGRFQEAMSCMEQAASLALAASLRECRALGAEMTGAQIGEALRHRIRFHQNRESVKNRFGELNTQLRSVLMLETAPKERGEPERRRLGRAWLDFSLSCAKVLVKYEADQQKQRMKEEQAAGQAEPEEKLAMG